MTVILLSMQTPGEAGRALAQRAKALRLLKAWTRETLASRAGVAPASLKRFETTGAGSLDLVLRVAFALGRLEDFTATFQIPELTSLAELEARQGRQPRRRGRL